ncbi:MAG TPA: hypothetical protein VF069_16375, partial [Streptosporangiaceae bacterium]
MSNAQWEPRHYSIVTIDIEGFGSPTRTDPIRAGLRKALGELIQSALDGMEESPLHAEGDTGDGKWLLFRPDMPKTRILQSFIPDLETNLHHHNRSASTAAKLRLRIGVHHGELIQQDSGYSGESLNHAFRIIDNDVVRQALRVSQSSLIIILSDDFYQKVVKPEYGSLRTTSYSPVVLEVKETNAVAWIDSSGGVAVTEPTDQHVTISIGAGPTEPRVLTLQDLPPTSLYITISDIHNAALYRRRFPEAPIPQHLETALLLAKKVVLHCADPYRSREVAELLRQFQPCIESGDLLFLLGENSQNPRTQFRGYIDYKIQQYRKSDLGERDVTSLVSVDANSADR